MTSQKSQRKVRSYVIREGRMTTAQSRALDELWPYYGVDHSSGSPFDFREIFGREAPVICEVGFGNGSAIRQLAVRQPECNFLGIEVHSPGIGNLLHRLRKDRVTNVRVVREDAVVVLEQAVPENSLDRLHMFFPDPWPKKRHHKRRILSPSFANLAASRLKPGIGIFHISTDWDDYAAQMLSVLNDCRFLEPAEEQSDCRARPEWRPETRFERRGIDRGHSITDIQMKRI